MRKTRGRLLAWLHQVSEGGHDTPVWNWLTAIVIVDLVVCFLWFGLFPWIFGPLW